MTTRVYVEFDNDDYAARFLYDLSVGLLKHVTDSGYLEED